MQYKVLVQTTTDFEVGDIITIKDGEGYCYDFSPRTGADRMGRYMFVEDAIKLGYIELYK